MIRGMARRYVAEFLGTFGIVFVPVAFSGAAIFRGAETSLLGAALVSGLSVSAMIAALGPVSAAHFNPAVTLGFAVAGRFTVRYVPGYWCAQVLGALTASGLCAAWFGAGHGLHIPNVAAGRAVGVEAVLTLLLMLVIIAAATDRRVDGAVPALAIGLTVVMDVLVGGSITGGSMNPARSFGPAVFGGRTALRVSWVYVLGPVLGAAVASRMFEAIRGDAEHAQGAPNELYDALQDVAASSS